MAALTNITAVATAVTGNAMRTLDAIDDTLHNPDRPWWPVFGWAENRYGVKPLKLLAWLTCLMAVYLSSDGSGPLLLADLVNFAYPAYVTVAAAVYRGGQPPMRTRAKSTAVPVVDATIRWFTYWTMYAAALIVEQLFGWLLRAVPYYCLLRTVFFVWCSLPVDANGSAFVYVVVVRRYFVKSVSVDRDNDDGDDE